MRTLIIEDEINIVGFLKKSLESEYFVVDSVGCGEDGLYLCNVNSYDIIILDYMLPGINGREVCLEIRKKDKQTPIIMLSAKSGVINKVDLLNIGADDYLTKPFSVQELLARIRALLRRPQKIEGNIISIGDLSLDSLKHLVKRDKKEIYLTRKEFILLEYLMRNKGIVLSRGMIMEHVWDMNADPFSNTIEAHIASLRRKVDYKNKKVIHTVPGRGYKVDIVS